MPIDNKIFCKRLVLAVLLAGGVAGGLFFSGGVFAGKAAVPAAQAVAEVVAHKALYEMQMVASQAGAGVTGIDGTLYFEQDDACDAWTTDLRSTMTYQYPERGPLLSSSHFVTWESKDGAQFEFTSERQENGQITEQLRGSARRDTADAPGRVEFVRPDGVFYDLPVGYLLPVQHTVAMVARAQAGGGIYRAVVFDGADAQGALEMNAVIGPPLQDKDAFAAAAEDIDAALLAGPAWPVRVAVFALEDQDDMVPRYEMDLVLHDSGVVSEAVVDYQVFKVRQRLKSLTALAAADCG